MSEANKLMPDAKYRMRKEENGPKWPNRPLESDDILDSWGQTMFSVVYKTEYGCTLEQKV